MKDFSQTKVLERLLGYERRLEGSLYRTMAELHKVQGQRQGAGGDQPPAQEERCVIRTLRTCRGEEDRRGPFHRVRETLPPDFTLDNLLAKIAALEEGPQTPKDAFGNPETPAGATTNTPPDHSCETNPISQLRIADCGLRIRDELAAGRSPGPAAPAPAGESCETNPICAAPRGTGIPSASLSGQAVPVNLNHGQDAHATIPPDGGTTNMAEAQRQSCETNPICVGPVEGQSLCGTGVRSDPAPSGSGETKPISTGANRGQAGYRPIFRRRR